MQAGGIPILLAYRSDAALKRAARIADGLNPFATWDFARLRHDVELFRQTAQEAGRNAAGLTVVLRANTQLTDSPLPEDARQLLSGTLEQWLADLKRINDLGITHVIFGSDTPAPLETQFRVLAEIREQVRW